MTEQKLPARPRRTAADPWGHEVGEDPEHLLDASGHAPHHRGDTVVAPAPVVIVEKPNRWWRFLTRDIGRHGR